MTINRHFLGFYYPAKDLRGIFLKRYRTVTAMLPWGVGGANINPEIMVKKNLEDQ